MKIEGSFTALLNPIRCSLLSSEENVSQSRHLVFCILFKSFWVQQGHVWRVSCAKKVSSSNSSINSTAKGAISIQEVKTQENPTLNDINVENSLSGQEQHHTPADSE